MSARCKILEDGASASLIFWDRSSTRSGQRRVGGYVAAWVLVPDERLE